MEQIRTIIKTYLVRSEKGPIALGDKKEAEAWLDKAKQKGIKARIQEILTNTDRVEELGYNLFVAKLPNTDLISLRNEVIKNMREYCAKYGLDYEGSNKEFIWRKISSKYDIDMPFNVFNKCVFDKIEFANV